MHPIAQTAIVTVLVAGAAGRTVADEVRPAKRETLLQTTESWNGLAYTKYPVGQPQLTVLKLTIAARTMLPWHSHPIPNGGYVLSGELIIEDRASGKKQTFHEGQAFGESVDDVHRGMAGDKPATVVVFYAGTAGTPLSVPGKTGEKEY